MASFRETLLINQELHDSESILITGSSDNGYTVTASLMDSILYNEYTTTPSDTLAMIQEAEEKIRLYGDSWLRETPH